MKKIWQLITSLKNATGNLLFLAIVALIVFVLVAQDHHSVPESAVMIIDPEGIIVEQKQAVDPVEQFLAGEEAEDPETLGRDLIDSIRLAADDERIKAIALDLSKLRGSTLTLYEDIARELDSFRESGKPVYAFGASYSQTQYYLAAFADKVYVDADSHPFLGGVFLQGFGAYPLYMKAALDKLYVTLHVIKAGLYKDAAETLTREDMSEYSREANQLLIGSLWGNYVQAIADRRGVPAETIADYIDNYADHLEAADRDANALALELGLIDAAMSRADWRNEMKTISGESGDTYNHISYRRFLAAVRPPIPVDNPTREKVAIIVAKGTILDGDHPPGQVGGDSIAKLIREARNNKTIKAIVLRIDSPGGSASASELIRSELALTQESGKPVVASMGGYAASGGYWIASTANRIFASESTITGSIGVFALFPTIEQSLEQLGIFSDGVGTTNLSGSFSQFRSINPIFERTLKISVEQTYNKFLGLVVEGRGMTMDEADGIAQGRVWTGTHALENGLIDAIGSLDDAIESAAMLADVDDYDVVFLEKKLSPREQLLQEILQTSVSLLPSLTVGLLPKMPLELDTLTKIAKSPGIYLQCLSCKVTF
ncbi:MAG: signal peptide peptidase SppA [Gammaproteobacteria bacterium]|nr:signal peptide peptidase SppA [Gammaproteobacteria bacterium]MBT7369817.1 signal peptide peptidase SppA [Gammaproteobacteria bacterium]